MKWNNKKYFEDLRQKWRRLITPSSTSDVPSKCFFVILYLIGAFLISLTQLDFISSNDLSSPLSYVIYQILRTIFNLYLIVAGIGLCILCILPLTNFIVQHHFRSIGLVNREGLAPNLIKKSYDPDNPKISIWEFSTRGIPLDVWGNKKAAIETAFDITITKIKYIDGKSHIVIYSVPAKSDLPIFVEWNDTFLLPQSFSLVLGETFTGPVVVDFSKIPHMLIGGSTGSGKSVLLKLVLMQAVKKGANVCISDFKGGVDYPSIWHQRCTMCFDESSTLKLLTTLTEELQYRKTLLADSGLPNIDEYNEATGKNLRRYIFACDEIAEVLDKTGLSKEQKDIIAKIESKLSIIARLGRAFGIHLILATQRPDANILSGQIKNNVNYRVCGRADTVLSQIILDNTDAADQIPKDSRGRFILHDGTVFQAYWFDDKGGF